MLVFGGVYRWSIEDWLVVSNIVYFHPYLRKWWKLTHIFQMGWNHQPDRGWSANKDVCMFLFCLQKKRTDWFKKVVVVSNVHPYLGRWSNLTNIFQLGLKPPTRKGENHCDFKLLSQQGPAVWCFGIQLSFGVQGATDWYHGGALEVIDVLLPAFKIWYMQI